MGEFVTYLTVSLLPTILTVVGILAFIVAVAIEVTKELTILKRIPTDLLVLVYSLITTTLFFIAFASYSYLEITAVMIIGILVVAIFVAFIASFGWQKFNELVDRFRNK